MKEIILAPLAVLSNLAMLSLFRVIGDNRGEVNPNPEPAPEPSPEPAPEPQPSAFDELMAKKGFKSNDDVAKSYQEAESTLNRTQNVFNTTKQQLEAAGYTVDEKGNITAAPQGQPTVQPQPTQQPYQQPYQQMPQGYQQPQVDPVYDPYTGNMLTDPVDIQLAQLPPSQRIGAVVNLMTEQREQQSRQAFDAEQEVLNKPEAKGFEDDVRRVMTQVPLANRTKKESWEDALLKVKGMKYDDALKSAGQQGVEEFLNKDQHQQIPAGQGQTTGSVQLSPEEEKSYQWYAQNQPGMFKDRKHFAQRSRMNTR